MIKICVIGLGYVGLPVALGLSSRFNTIGYDKNRERISELRNRYDSNSEFSKKNFYKKKISFISDKKEINNCNFYIICLPTPVNKNKVPNIKPALSSLKLLKNKIKKDDIVVIESTVYPGFTKSFSDKMSKLTGLKNNLDFFTCYSPERINPGDNSKKLSKIEKIFAINTSNKKVLNKVKQVYKLISKKIIFSKKISETETAKVLENTQRDLNIALFNELLMLSEKLKLNFNEVIRLAASKWNFLKFSPGLVGGHCLPVDPYYLSHIAKKNKFKMKVALAGRSVNNSMKNYVLNKFRKIIVSHSMKKNTSILIVGLSYKYGVSDLRNSLNLEIYNAIKRKYPKTKFYDPFILEKISFKKSLLNSVKMIIFLSKGKKFLKLYKIIKNNKKIKILDPFKYYENI